jgi:hypothetical protein
MRVPGVAIGAMTAAAFSTVLIGLLHVHPESAHLSPKRRTISEYALLETGWIFDTAVLALAASTAAVLVALVRAGLLPAVSAAAGALLLASAGFAGVVVFPKHDWSVGPSLHGDIHRIAGVVAFICLPLAAILLARTWLGHPGWRAYAYLTLALGLLTLLSFAPIAGAFLLEPVTGVPWWRAVPLGAVERAVGLVEVATLVSLAWWAMQHQRVGRVGHG